MKGGASGEARTKLIVKYPFSERQANVIFEMRKTRIVVKEGEFKMEVVIGNTGCLISVTHKGFITRTGGKCHSLTKM